jgi:hypothetical protein
VVFCLDTTSGLSVVLVMITGDSALSVPVDVSTLVLSGTRLTRATKAAASGFFKAFFVCCADISTAYKSTVLSLLPAGDVSFITGVFTRQGIRLPPVMQPSILKLHLICGPVHGKIVTLEPVLSKEVSRTMRVGLDKGITCKLTFSAYC